MLKMASFNRIVLFVSILSEISSKTIGPDMVARARLLRDLPLGRTLSGQDRVLPKSRERTLIELNLSLRSIDLNFSTGTLIADGWMSLKWNDPRYSWEPSDYEDLTSMPLPFSTSWAPEVILHNAVEEKFIYRQVGIVRHNGDFVYLVSIHTKSSCAPNYSRAGNGNSSSSMNSDINLDEFNSPTGWQIVAAEARLESAQYPLFEEPSHMVVYTISFKRDVYFDTNTGTLKRKDDATTSSKKSRHEI